MVKKKIVNFTIIYILCAYFLGYVGIKMNLILENNINELKIVMVLFFILCIWLYK